jgi:BioD-like phosphotransacetylase family protein
MATLLVASLQARAGRTAVAAALVQRLVYDGRRAVAVRLGGSGDPAAVADASFFATLPGALGRGGSPVPAASAAAEVSQLAAGGAAVVEAGAQEDLPALATALDAQTVLVYHGLPDEDAVLRLQDSALALDAHFLGVVLNALPSGALARAQAVMDDAALPLLAALPEDRLLYAPTIAEIADALEADLLLGDEDDGQVIEHLMIGPISSDPGQPYYAREGNKAIIARSDKTDLQLAALQTDTDCLILTGGFAPSPYTLDRASSEEVAVMLTRSDTRATVGRLEEIYQRSRFGSERKLERLGELLRERLDFESLLAALS